jgi:hypothetical protein
MKNVITPIAFAALLTSASAAAAYHGDGVEGLGVPSANDGEIVARMRRRRQDDAEKLAQRSRRAEVVDSGANRPGTKNRRLAPHGQPRNAWRYMFYEGRWWYWAADERWSFYNGRRWVMLPGSSSGRFLARQGGSAGGGSLGGSTGSIPATAGSRFTDSLGAAARNIASGFNDNSSPGIGGMLGGNAGALGQDSELGVSTIPRRVGGTSRAGNDRVGTGGGGLGVVGAGGSIGGGAGGSVGGGAGGPLGGSSRSGDAGSGVGGGSIGGTSVTGGAGAGSSGR